MKKIAIILIALACVGSAFFLSRCKKETANAATSQLGVAVKDAPMQHCDHVRLEIRGVRVYSERYGWITIPVNDTILDILQLQDTSALLGVVNVDAGTITKVQVMLGQDDSVTIGGINYVLDLTDSSLIVSVNDTLVSNGSFTLVVDINAAQSIFDNGNGNQHHFWMGGSASCFFRRQPHRFFI